MKHLELDLEHHYKNKFVGRHRIRPRNRSLVLGHSKAADIRLLGDDVSEVHAYIEYENGVWSVMDAGSSQGTWIQKKHITSEKVEESTTVTIGGHTLKLTPREYEVRVFEHDQLKSGTSMEGHSVYHQVVVRKGEFVIRTETLSPRAPFHFVLDGKVTVLPPPSMDEVKKTEFGAFSVSQRMVRADVLEVKAKDLLIGWNEPEMRAPVLTSLAIFVLLAGLILAIPHKPAEELEELKQDNKYTRMIFDAELVKKKRAEAKEMRKTIMASAPKAANQKMNTLSTPVKSKGATPKVVSNIKTAGISALLGKISKRANTKGPMVVGFGKIADSGSTGHSTTVAAVGSLQGVATGTAGNGGDTYKVGGVGTFGKGGGNGRGLAGVGGLATGGVGSGTVGILDEETEIEGGLDKEVIAKVISNYLGEVRYCYERQLSAEPDLYGKVQVKFTIDANGSVSEQRVGLTTLKSAMVEGCILRRLARWKFPKPKGGTHVLVTYPFMFKATN